IGNPGVSGLGVLIGFVGTGCLIVLILIGHYIFTYDPTLDTFRGPDERQKRSLVPNVVDVVVLKRLRGAMSLIGINFEWLNNHNGGMKIEKALNKLVLSMSDIQIVTGLAILISAYHGLPRSLSRYHWLMIPYTA
ncbi:peptidyl-prolyl cis-trans isomerase, partial [Colletotrichum asianum]